MSNLFKKVRIVHSPDERRYIVEQCRVWSWQWEQVDHFPYVDVRNSSPHSVHDLSGDAYDKAKKKAEMLLARSVVWEQSNYFIGN